MKLSELRDNPGARSALLEHVNAVTLGISAPRHSRVAVAGRDRDFG